MGVHPGAHGRLLAGQLLRRGLQRLPHQVGVALVRRRALGLRQVARVRVRPDVHGGRLLAQDVPEGQDVLDTRMDTTDKLLYQVQNLTFQLYVAEKYEEINENATFSLTFKSTINETFTTIP